MKTLHERQAITLLLILIALGGIILYGNEFPESQTPKTNETNR